MRVCSTWLAGAGRSASSNQEYLLSRKLADSVEVDLR